MHCCQPQLGAHPGHEFDWKALAVGLQRLHHHVGFADQRLQRLAQAEQVPVHHVGLAVEGIAPLGVAVVADVVRHESVEKLERTVVNGQAQDAHVVGVEHAVAKTHCLPLRYQRSGAQGHGLQQGGVGVAAKFSAGAALGVMVVDDMVGQRAQLCQLVARGEMLEMAEADETGRGAGNDGSGLHAFAAHRFGRTHNAQRARGGNAQRVHGFAAQVLADA